jgi:hypothetical protein
LGTKVNFTLIVIIQKIKRFPPLNEQTADFEREDYEWEQLVRVFMKKEEDFHN